MRPSELPPEFSDDVLMRRPPFLPYYIAAFLAVFVLRRRAPDLPRPYKAVGYPVATLVVLMGSVGFLIAGAYALASRSRRSRMPQHAPEPELMP